MADIETSLEGGVLTLTMNRPERMNALSLELGQGMMAAIEAASADPDIGAIVLTGAGRAFCAGGDVKTMAARGEQTAEMRLEILRNRSRLALIPLVTTAVRAISGWSRAARTCLERTAT